MSAQTPLFFFFFPNQWKTWIRIHFKKKVSSQWHIIGSFTSCLSASLIDAHRALCYHYQTISVHWKLIQKSFRDIRRVGTTTVRWIISSMNQISITSIAPPLFPIAHAHRKPTSSTSVSQSGLWPTSVKSHIVLILRGLAIKTLYSLYQYSLNTSVSRELIGAVFMKTPRRATKPAFPTPLARKPGWLLADSDSVVGLHLQPPQSTWQGSLHCCAQELLIIAICTCAALTRNGRSKYCALFASGKPKATLSGNSPASHSKTDSQPGTGL